MRKFLKNLWRIITTPFRIIFWIFRRLGRGIKNVSSEIHGFFAEEVEDAPVGDALSKAWDHPQELFVHLDALRKHLLRSVAVLVITTAMSFAFFEQILAFLSRPLQGEQLVAIEVTEPISTVMQVSLLAGVALAFPYIALELWLFIAPGLSRKARIWGCCRSRSLQSSSWAGWLLPYFVMMPAAMPVLLNFMGIYTVPRPKSYISFVTALLFWMGVFFEFPLVIFLLAKLGLVKASLLAKQWRLAVVIIAVIAAAITPTLDPVNMALVMGPMVFLYFFSVLIGEARPATAKHK